MTHIIKEITDILKSSTVRWWHWICENRWGTWETRGCAKICHMFPFPLSMNGAESQERAGIRLSLSQPTHGFPIYIRCLEVLWSEVFHITTWKIIKIKKSSHYRAVLSSITFYPITNMFCNFVGDLSHNLVHNHNTLMITQYYITEEFYFTYKLLSGA